MSDQSLPYALRHPWRVVGAWIGIVVVAIVIIGTLLGSALTTEQRTVNDPESMRGFDLLERHFPDRDRIADLVVVRSESISSGSPEFTRFVSDFTASLPEGIELVPTTPGPADERNLVSRDGRALLLPLQVDDDVEEGGAALVDAVEAADRNPDFTVTVTGRDVYEADLNALSETDLRKGELYVGLPVAMLVLLLVFGTIVGALLPLLVAVVAIICALALAALVGQQWEVSLFLVNMVSGMGLALGIDYSLFVLSRYREERALGSDRDAAIRTTRATASRAVLFSGITFVVALTGMLLVPTNIMRSLAAGAILVGITAVAAALTLLPALLRLLGDRVDSLPVPLVGRAAARGADPDHGFWAALVRRVMRRPLVWGGAVTVLLLAAAVPLTGMDTGASGVSTFPKDLPSRVGAEALRESFPAQAASPARIVVHDPRGVDQPRVQAAVDRLTTALGADERFGDIAPELSPDGKLAVVNVAVGADALATEAVDAVRDLRGDLVPDAFADAPDTTQALVTGETAANVDYFDVMRDWLPIVLGFVLTLSFVILLVVFRSLTVPIVAIVLNLLSVGATYGLLVLVFQHGFGTDLLGLTQVETTEAWVPLFLFSVLFGLSMDYHMLLLTRIRERWLRTGDTAGAVSWAVGSTGRVITGAAFIIVAVFTGFAVGDLVMFQQMGFGIAAALLIDATLVRGVLLPAAMALLGEANWFLPRALRWIPELQLEREDGATHM